MRTDKVEIARHLIKEKNNGVARVLFARTMIFKTEISYFARGRTNATLQSQRTIFFRFLPFSRKQSSFTSDLNLSDFF